MSRALTGPRSPVHPAPALLRAAASEASKPRGPWLGRGEGSTPARAEGSRATPRGRCRAWGTGLGRGAVEPVLLLSRGGLPGCGDWPSGAPAAQHKQARDPESPASAGGGRAGGGGGPPGNPSLSGTCGSGRRRGHTADPSPRQALARLPARRLPEDLGGDAGPWVSKPGAQRTKLTSAKGQGGVTKWALSLGAGPFLKGKAKKHPESGLAEGY